MNPFLAPFLDLAEEIARVDLADRGGPTEADRVAARVAGEDLAHSGDLLLYGGKGSGELLSRVARARAVVPR